MRLSEITAEVAAQYAVVEPDEPLLPAFIDAARYHVLAYTGLTAEEAEEKPDVTVAALALVTELVDNRQFTADSDKVNQVLASLLDCHRRNFL